MDLCLRRRWRPIDRFEMTSSSRSTAPRAGALGREPTVAQAKNSRYETEQLFRAMGIGIHFLEPSPRAGRAW